MKAPWKIAADVLKKGGVVIIPSDSVYGIAALARDELAVKKLYTIKKRDQNKPSLVIASSLSQAKSLIKFTDLAEKMASRYWPGGLTLVGEAIVKGMPISILGPDNTLAVRLPDKRELITLAKESGPFILPSANLSGATPPSNFNDLDPELLNQVDFTINEKTDNNPVSTLVDIRGSLPVVLRQGAVTINLNNP